MNTPDFSRLDATLDPHHKTTDVFVDRIERLAATVAHSRDAHPDVLSALLAQLLGERASVSTRAAMLTDLIVRDVPADDAAAVHAAEAGPLYEALRRADLAIAVARQSIAAHENAAVFA